MKTRRFLALVLALLMVIPAAVLPAAAGTVIGNGADGKKVVTYSFTALTDSELDYLMFESTAITYPNNEANTGRVGDQGQWFSYFFPLRSDVKPDKITFSAYMGGKIKMSISSDNQNWTVVHTRTTTDNELVTVDLTKDVGDLWNTVAPENLYIKFENTDTSTGWGPNMLRYTNYDAKQEAVTSLTMEYPTGTELDECTILSFLPSKDYSSEAPYFRADLSVRNSTDSTNDSCHFADANCQLVYAYELLTTELPKSMSLTFKTSNQLKLSLSVDSYHWFDVYEWTGTLNSDGSGGLPAQVMTFDLMTAYQEALENDTTGSTMLYIRVGDSYPDKGWGGQIMYGTPFKLCIGYAPVADGLNMVDYTSTIQGTSADQYYLSGGAVSGSGRYADAQAKVVFKYPVTGIGSSERITLTMTPSQQFHLEVSIDGINWVTAFRYVDTGLLVKSAANATQSGQKFTSRERTFDLTDAVHKAAAISAEQGTTDAGFYFRYGDSHPVRVAADGHWMVEGETLTVGDATYYYNSGSGWGGYAKGDVKLSVAVTDNMGSAAETDRVVMDKVDIYSYNSDNDTFTYQFIENEPMLVTTDTGLPCGKLSTNIGAGTVTTAADGTMTSTGDGNYNGRFADNNDFFIYRYQVPATANTMVWSAVLGGGYGVDVAISDEWCPDPYDESLWTNVALWSDDGLNGTTGHALKVISYDLTGKGTESGDKYIYLKFYDADWEHNGYGVRVALGSDYPVTMSWSVSYAQDAASAGIESVALNLTENFNLVYKLNIPLSSQDTKVEAGFTGGTMVELTPEEDGTYRFTGIRPARIGDKVTLRLTGKAGGVYPYSYEKEYSVEEYCYGMLEYMPNDKALVDLMESILYYGAAAQRVNGKTDGLADAKLPARDFSSRPDVGGVFAGVPVNDSEQKVPATWERVDWEGDGDTTLLYVFKVNDGFDPKNLTVTLTNNRGEKQTYYYCDDYKDAEYQYYDYHEMCVIRIPVKAHDFHTAYVATFSYNGEEYSDYRMVYSVNSYIYNSYDADGTYINNPPVSEDNQKKQCALVGALGNYGLAVWRYLTDLSYR